MVRRGALQVREKSFDVAANEVPVMVGLVVSTFSIPPFERRCIVTFQRVERRRTNVADCGGLVSSCGKW